jgi:arylsulfatase A-like enzyme
VTMHHPDPDPREAATSHRRLGAVLLAALVVAAGADARAAAAAGERPNVLLISIDSLRADHLSAYGYERRTSPSLDQLAADGVLFEYAMSATNWTMPAHASLFTGQPISVHEASSNESRLAEERGTLAEALGAVGYRTAGFWGGPYLDPRFGMSQGFDDYVDCTGYAKEKPEPGPEGEAAPWITPATRSSHEDITGPRTVAAVESWLDAHAKDGEPFFLFVHLWDVHYDYIPPEPWATMFDPDYEGDQGGSPPRPKTHRPEARDLHHLVALYDGEIAWTDHNVGRMLGLLEARGLTGRTLVVVTADHGEEFFEHGRFGHRSKLFDESIRIPLIFRYPGKLPSGRRIPDVVGLTDVAPTILALVGAGELPAIWGRSLVPLLRAERFERPGGVVSEFFKTNAEKSMIAVRTSEWKYIARSDGETWFGLWDLAKDPGEQTDVYGADPARTEQARQVLADRLEQLETARAQSPSGRRGGLLGLADDLKKQLEALGYLGD